MISSSLLMKQAAAGLPSVISYPDGFPIYFLTGEKYLYQTLFCIQSLVKTSGTKFRFILVDDGSFSEKLISSINKQLPGAEIITGALIEKNLHKNLPPKLLPNLYHRRKVYPHLRKLTDVHTLGGNKWKLVLDSDMLFWAEPKAIIDWLDNPQKPMYMLDCKTSYGYSGHLMADLSNNSIPDLLNVGVIGLNSEAIDWGKVDKWIKVLEETEGTSYYLEQALTAMLIGDGDAEILSPDSYIVNPGIDIINNNKGILHHYVDLSKEGYFKIAWKKI